MSTSAKTNCAGARLPNATAFVAAAGWAALEEYVDDKLLEARRAKRIAERACAQSPRDYWDGQVGALAKLRRNIARWKKAPPNAPGEPPAREKE